ncbi:2574_t:CDS:2, partial [Paraglomus brasilianum]
MQWMKSLGSRRKFKANISSSYHAITAVIPSCKPGSEKCQKLQELPLKNIIPITG